jgi:hypothetical protein
VDREDGRFFVSLPQVEEGGSVGVEHFGDPPDDMTKLSLPVGLRVDRPQNADTVIHRPYPYRII